MTSKSFRFMHWILGNLSLSWSYDNIRGWFLRFYCLLDLLNNFNITFLLLFLFKLLSLKLILMFEEMILLVQERVSLLTNNTVYFLLLYLKVLFRKGRKSAWNFRERLTQSHITNFRSVHIHWHQIIRLMDIRSVLWVLWLAYRLYWCTCIIKRLIRHLIIRLLTYPLNLILTLDHCTVLCHIATGIDHRIVREWRQLLLDVLYEFEAFLKLRIHIWCLLSELLWVDAVWLVGLLYGNWGNFLVAVD